MGDTQPVKSEGKGFPRPLIWGSARGRGGSKSQPPGFSFPFQLRFVQSSAFELRGLSSCTLILTPPSRPRTERRP